MTLNEFRAWFEAFSDGMRCAARGDDLLGIVAQKMAEIDEPVHTRQSRAEEFIKTPTGKAWLKEALEIPGGKP